LTLGRAKWQGSELTKVKSAEYALKKSWKNYLIDLDAKKTTAYR
jgi:hypothetical protein